ncbi:N-methyl-L-tryptophan oxidase [Cohnella sp. JJ-181]|uniref:N-methyl-L-tryptophan oxidase n=1 Tax=Cohnella rhizoplanae TaxID=2974897 RepID=UPI0022FFA1CB|nr:N-methyl-L-tryptophan oxidase [Cohnella sp. JJ-181]CAI6053178.1 Monomeric sarcosine oxidase [Cohnella sp. JJ-181]
MSGISAYDVIVVGAGSMGMSAGYHLAARGLRTLLIDAFDPPHTGGSHHGEPRLIRHVYHGGGHYVRLALRADALWRELESLTGQRLLERSGVLNVSDPCAYAFDGRFADADREGVLYESLDAAEIARRWPGWRVPAHYRGLYEPDAGYLFSERCVAAYRSLALAEGAELLTDTAVLGIGAQGGGLTVSTSRGDYAAGRVIVSAGAWFKSLAPSVDIPVQAVRKVVGWFEADERLYGAGRLPGFTFGGPGGGYYGFPSIDGAGVKIGRHDGGRPWQPGERLEPFGAYPEDESDLRAALREFLPGADGRLVRGAVCKYELSPDEQFIVDEHPSLPGVLLAGGFSGHGFKFASAIGEALAEWTASGTPPADLLPFSLSRFPSATAASTP